jgi:DNA adenine methylase
MVVLSGYDCALYRELFGEWKSVHRKAQADGARSRMETLWFNPAAAKLVRIQGELAGLTAGVE